ncbi:MULTISPECIES: hypothetical protein [unclassified Microcoleus]|uniref:hypothetical protein n=1 Tax=unclassified Microcoleus TaxID=2642155 RepID=UPI001D65920A|nr:MULTISPECIES: hypothetical protein [unclassified Microcoleus]MCC3421463.1 hypothetical protein [Microcoleus sp. PH2017_07_MST_O_A]MCC3448060.1 hypothetical protein [Microcoleus sp. PH2017_09_SFU_O_A]MCC3503155.1 hypothetical protein [Microcoleus sp. PH2017_19_SFW_U_A]MCC3565613.1 hypothetical protein [Microcoleus sp. PH2017_31_RDM_U_A]MCC3437709.1 hypothetical protein [Microcoleus sp. PH2017_05_CCC_O_A]
MKSRTSSTKIDRTQDACTTRLVEEISYNKVQKTVPNRVYTSLHAIERGVEEWRLKLRYPLLGIEIK